MSKESVIDCNQHAQCLRRRIKRGHYSFKGTPSGSREWAVFVDGITPRAVPRHALGAMRRYQCLHRFVGVYTLAATAEQIADDIRATLKVMPIYGARII